MTFKTGETDAQILQRILRDYEPIFNQYLANAPKISDLFTYLKILDNKRKAQLPIDSQ